MNPPVLLAGELLAAAIAGSGNVIFAADVVSVHDGDTFGVDVRLPATVYGADRPIGFGLAVKGHRLWLRTKVRIGGVNAAELGTPGGDAAAANLTSMLPVGTLLELSGVHVDDYGGRWDATVRLPDGGDLSTVLIAGQWAAPYSGRGPKPVPPWPRTNESVS